MDAQVYFFNYCNQMDLNQSSMAACAAAVGGVIMVISSIIYIKQPTVRYTIDAHYLNDDVMRICLTGTSEPCIEAYHGTYKVKTNRQEELGVVRFDLVATDTIKTTEQ